jgi:hypothetical protein
MPVPDFSPGEVLTAAAMDSISGWLVKTQTVGSGVSSVTVTGAFSADYQNYKILYTGGTNSTDTGMNLALGASATGYYSGTVLIAYASGSLSQLNSNNATVWQNAGAALIGGAFLDVDLYRPFDALNTALVINSRPDLRTGGAASIGGGYHNVASSFTAFTVTPGSGTLTGGTIRVYGYRN